MEHGSLGKRMGRDGVELLFRHDSIQLVNLDESRQEEVDDALEAVDSIDKLSGDFHA